MIGKHPMPTAAAALAAARSRFCRNGRRARQGRRLATTVALLHADDRGGRQAQAPMQRRLAAGAVAAEPAAVCHPVQADDIGLAGLMNRLGTGPAEAGA